MAHIRDVRRLSTVVLFAVGLLVLYYLFLRLHVSGNFEWFLPRRSIELMSLTGWTTLIVVLSAFAASVVAFLIFSIPVAKDSGRAIGGVRQVQCQDCQAVFRLTDSGERPLTHLCPSCGAYGVYDGTLPPVGEAPVPKPAVEVKRASLTCRNCSHRFGVTDTGARPLRVQCPNCEAVGKIR